MSRNNIRVYLYSFYSKRNYENYKFSTSMAMQNKKKKMFIKRTTTMQLADFVFQTYFPRNVYPKIKPNKYAIRNDR